MVSQKEQLVSQKKQLEIKDNKQLEQLCCMLAEKNK